MEALRYLALQRNFGSASAAAKELFEQGGESPHSITALEYYLVFGVMNERSLNSEFEEILAKHESELPLEFVVWLRGYAARL